MTISDKARELIRIVKAHKGKIVVEIGTSLIYVTISKSEAIRAFQQSRLPPKFIRVECHGNTLCIEHDYGAFEQERASHYGSHIL